MGVSHKLRLKRTSSPDALEPTSLPDRTAPEQNPLRPETSSLRRSEPSLRHLAAVEDERLARHKVGGRRREVDHERAQLLRASHPARGDLAKNFGLHLLVAPGCCVHIRLDVARG